MRTSQENREAPPPMWSVTLNKMRANDGGRLDADVTLTPVEAQAFVEHYLETSRQLDRACGALIGIQTKAMEGLRGY